MVGGKMIKPSLFFKAELSKMVEYKGGTFIPFAAFLIKQQYCR
ncbi:hypothetical protein ACDN41_06920 [Priestia aryabhattai]